MDQDVVQLHVDYNNTVSFAQFRYGLPILETVTIVNNSNLDLENTVLSVASPSGFFVPLEVKVPSVAVGATVVVDCCGLAPVEHSLSSLEEPADISLEVFLTDTLEENIAFVTCDLHVLAYDQWQGDQYPELLASFVTPDYPQIDQIIKAATQLLQSWTGNGLWDGYSSKDTYRVRAMAAAIYRIIAEVGIYHQKSLYGTDWTDRHIQLADEVLSSREADSLDMSILFVSCLEAVGLNGLLALDSTRAYAGVWLENTTFPEFVGYDASNLTKRANKGVNQMALVDCSGFGRNHQLSYEEAEQAAESYLEESATFSWYLDISRARLSGVKALPRLVLTDTGLSQLDSLDATTAGPAPARYGVDTSVVDEEQKKLTKLDVWERGLLDLTMRNRLLNMRVGKSALPFMTYSVHDVEDVLSSDGKLKILPRPAEIPRPEQIDFEYFRTLSPHNDLLKQELGEKRLRTPLAEGELEKTLINLYRSSSSTLEETGTNTLFMAVGALRWRDKKKSDEFHYAPLILLPVDLERESARGNFTLSLNDTKPRINMSLLEMLRHDHGIEIPGLDPLPEDENGVDVRLVFNTVMSKIIDREGWDILEVATLGIFSFSQLIMWEDIRGREDMLRRSKVVSSLMDGKLTWDAQPMVLGDKVESSGMLLPIQTDSSQLFAIKSAAAGNSFVLHGPPGTGKSQTITGLIANALAEGKTVLFVAEKMAALNVVQHRLDELGIGAFCLEAHSNKIRKSDIMRQLEVAASVSHSEKTRDYAQKLSEVNVVRSHLDSFADALYRPQRVGKTLREAISDYLRVADGPTNIKLGEDFATAISGSSDITRLRRLVDDLVTAANEVGTVSNHPLSMVTGTKFSYQIRYEMVDLLNNYRDNLLHLDAAASAVADTTGLEKPSTVDQWGKFPQTASKISGWSQLPSLWAQAPDFAALMKDIIVLADAGRVVDASSADITDRWTPEFLDMDPQALLDQWTEARSAGFFSRRRAISTVVKKLSFFSKTEIDEDGVDDAIRQLMEHNKVQGDFDAKHAAISDYVDDLPAFENHTWDDLEALAAHGQESYITLVDVTGSDVLRTRLAGNTDMPVQITSLKTSLQAVGASYSNVVALLGDLRVDETADWMSVQLKTCDVVEANMSDLHDWMNWNAECETARQANLGPVVDAIYSGMNLVSVRDGFERALAISICIDIFKNTPEATDFTGSMFDNMIEQYSRVESELRELARKEIYYRLAAQVPNLTVEASKSEEAGILQKAIRSRGRGVSVRKLFKQIPDLLNRLVPCMLMSPISVATFLDPERLPFDLVVFDEASQLQTAKAVGALARGRDAVIVGDPKQMPPTTFFQASTSEDDLTDMDDLESVLDDCLAINMPSTYLQWHYRSRHESLIAFSNREFYENRLSTFPSADDSVSHVTSKFVGGSYKRRGGVNEVEAQCVVDEIHARFEDEKLRDLSVGVVTFNIKQQELIEDLLEAAAGQDEKFNAWMVSGDEPLFVKNLENVQGDERDVILFSTTYGPDEDGKMYMNFGPLNREGGWRRLNVAVTRSRQDMIIITSLKPEMIDTKRTKAEGARALKEFLTFSRNGFLAGEEVLDSESGRSDEIANQISDFLEDAGYQVVRNVGRSSFRVDIGVCDPEDPDTFILGIMLDGPFYRDAKTTRDRELAPQALLGRLGWDTLRVWSLDWWEDAAKVSENIISRIAHARAIKRGDPIEVAPVEPVRLTPAAVNVLDEFSFRTSEKVAEEETPVEEIQGENSEFEIAAPAPVLTVPVSDIARTTYEATKLRKLKYNAETFMHPSSAKAIKAHMEKVLATESPVADDVIFRRVCGTCGISRIGSKVRGRCAEILQTIEHLEAVQGERLICWRADENPLEYRTYRECDKEKFRRRPENIPVMEIANAQEDFASQAGGAIREELIREAAHIFGYQRISPAVRASMNAGVDWAIEQGRLVANADGVLSPAHV